MKVLSFKQPWAELILQGKKKIDLRKWNTKFRGKFLIHASKIPDKKANQRFSCFPHKVQGKAMKKFNLKKLLCGFIIGKAKLVNVKKYANKKEFNKDKNLHLADNSFGNYGFILKEVKRIKPIKAKGQLGFWNFDKK